MYADSVAGSLMPVPRKGVHSWSDSSDEQTGCGVMRAQKSSRTSLLAMAISQEHIAQ